MLRSRKRDVARARSWHALQLSDAHADEERARFLADCTMTPGPGRLVFGRLLTPRAWEWVGLRTDRTSGQHVMVSGGSGCGKTAGTAVPLILQHLLYHPDEVLLVEDKKGELARLVPEILAALPNPPQILDILHVITPNGIELDDGHTYLPHLNLTLRESGLSPELQTLGIVAGLAAAIGDLGGLRMTRVIARLVQLAIEGGYPLTRLRVWLQFPETFARDAKRSRDPLLRAYGAQFATVEPAATRDALASRLDLILFQRETQLCLSAPRCFNLRGALATPGSVIVLDLCDQKSASERSLVFWSALLTTLIMAAILSRPITDDTPHITWIAEEWHTGLEKDEARGIAKVSSLARFKRLSLVTINQAFSPISQIDSSLPKLLRTNSTVEIAYRPSPEDAPMLTPPTLDSHAARSFAQRLTRLARREASLWIKPYAPQFIRSPRIDFDRLRRRAAEANPELRYAILRGVDSDRRDVLEAHLALEEARASAYPPAPPSSNRDADPRFPSLG